MVKSGRRGSSKGKEGSYLPCTWKACRPIGKRDLKTQSERFPPKSPKGGGAIFRQLVGGSSGNAREIFLRREGGSATGSNEQKEKRRDEMTLTFR